MTTREEKFALADVVEQEILHAVAHWKPVLLSVSLAEKIVEVLKESAVS